MKKEIKFQLNELKLNNEDSENNTEELSVIMEVNGGVDEHLKVYKDDITLDCTMQWETGKYSYSLSKDFLCDILSKKPFTQITSNDLRNHESELIKNTNGNLIINSINGYGIEDTSEVSDYLKDTEYQLSEEEMESSEIESIIEEKMQSLYSQGDIGESEIEFHNLFSLEIENSNKAYVDTSWWDVYLKMARTEHDDENFITSINYSFQYLYYELDTNVEDYIKNIDLSKSIPDNISSTFRLISESFESSEQWEKAIEYYLHYVKINPNNDYGYAHIARCYDELEQIDDAIEFYNKAIKINPHNIYAITQYADILVKKKGDNDSALKVLDEGIKNNPTQPKNTTNISWLFRLKGEIFWKKDETAESVDCYEKAVKNGAGSEAFCFLRIGHGYYKLNNYEKSISAFEKCYDLSDQYKDGFTYYWMADSLKRAKRYEEAIKYSQLAIDINDERINRFAYSILGSSKLQIKDYEGAVSAYLNSSKDKWDLHNLGKSYYALNQYENALNEFNSVIEKDPNYKYAYQGKGDSLFYLKKYNEALESYEKLLELDDTYPWLNAKYNHVGTNLALLYHFKGNFEKANSAYKDFSFHFSEKLWKNYLKIMSQNNEGTNNIFTNPIDVQLLTDEDVISKGNKIFLNNARLNRVISTPLYREGKNKNKYNLEICLNDLEIILKDDISNYEALYYRASINSWNYGEKNNYTEKAIQNINIDSAKKDLLKCLKKNDFFPAYKLIVSIEGNHDNISDVIKKGNELFNSEETWWYSLACGAELGNNFNKAKEYYTKVLEFDNERAKYHYGLGNSYLGLDDVTNSIESFTKAVELVDWEDTYRYGLAKAYLLNSEIELAEKAIKQALDIYSGDNRYFELYVEILNKKDIDKKVKQLMSDFVSETSPGDRNKDDSINEKILNYLQKCDNYSHSENHLFFQYWEVFKFDCIDKFLKGGSYLTKLALSRNNSLNKGQIQVLLEEGTFSILQNVIANPEFSLEELKDIVQKDDGSYQYSYKLMGVILNPNADQSLVESLKNNSYNWIKKLVYSKIDKYSNEDLNDKYKLQGLLNNNKVDKKSKSSFEKNIEKLESNTYTINFDTEVDVNIIEYVYSEFEYEDLINELSESVLSDDESWADHCSSNWHEYGESEYGLEENSLEVYLVSGDTTESAYIDFGNRENQFDPEKDTTNKNKFIFQAESAESGKVTFGEIYSEFEFRPEFLDLSLTDYKCLVSGIEYYNPDTDESYHSSMELLNSRTHETDIRLAFKNKDGELIDANYYEDIKANIEKNGEEINEKTIDSYFKN